MLTSKKKKLALTIHKHTYNHNLFQDVDDDRHDYKFLGSWGPNFMKLAEIYTQTQETEAESEHKEKL